MNPKAKILITEPGDFSDAAIKILRTDADVTISKIKNLQDAFKNFDVVWIRLSHKIDGEVLKGTIRCKIIVTPVTGIDHIDENLCRLKGVEIISLRGEADFLKEVRATAELTVALTLTLIRNLFPAINSVLQGKWNRDKFRGNEIYDKKVGVIGMGRLGKIVSEYFKAFGAQVTGYDISGDFPENIERSESLEELITFSDIVTLHVNYTEATENLIGENEFNFFKRDAVLVNTSRGGVIDESALLTALESGKLKGAAIDVLREELNFSESNPLAEYARKNSNLIITPHLGGNTYESFEKTEILLAKKLVSRLKELAV